MQWGNLTGSDGELVIGSHRDSTRGLLLSSAIFLGLEELGGCLSWLSIGMKVDQQEDLVGFLSTHNSLPLA